MLPRVSCCLFKASHQRSTLERTGPPLQTVRGGEWINTQMRVWWWRTAFRWSCEQVVRMTKENMTQMQYMDFKRS